MTLLNPAMCLKSKHSFNQKKYFKSKEQFSNIPESEIKKIEIALDQVDAGLGIPAEQFFREMEEQYGFNG